MTKRIRILAALACALLLALGPGAAALADTQGTQTLSTTVPDPTAPSWTLNIPADVAIAYRATDTSIGWVAVSDVQNVGIGKRVICEISYTDFASGAGTISLGVAYDLYADGILSPPGHLSADGASFVLYNGAQPDRTFRAEVFALVDAADWAAAAPGVYTATVTYTSELLAKD